ncbi:hypothetical protein HT99x_015750 [Candidatus Berkiella aquae]|uniref:Uncharacterized protein n=1 Tax=Candidatus Berkiella aquae TaxID=295108 RepID=A0AAE3LBE7_9GAMM|nr:hypothetical protein [Candidatus Berkiella aquae]
MYEFEAMQSGSFMYHPHPMVGIPKILIKSETRRLK